MLHLATCRPFGLRTLLGGLLLALASGGPARADDLQKSRLLVALPDYVATPDGMAIDPAGNLVVAAPNFADPRLPGCLIKIDRDLHVGKWVEVPPLAETGHAYPMGIAFGPDGDVYVCDNQNWAAGNGKQGQINQGRLLRLRIRDGRVEKTTVVARSISHPNGVRVRNGQVYLTVSMLPKVKRPDGLLTSAVYRFGADDRDIRLLNTLDDPNLLVALVTYNRDCQYGADGLDLDSRGNLFIGNFGDGALYKVTFDARGKVLGNTLFAKTDLHAPMSDPDFRKKMVRARMRSTDGVFIDRHDNIYVADFSNNAVCRVDPQGHITLLAQSPDGNGIDGGLSQPGEPIVWNGKLVLSCFDLVTGPDKVNTKHHKPATLAWLPCPSQD
jgi:sugar lactone lactonase YvrE